MIVALGIVALADVVLIAAWLGVITRRRERAEARYRNFICDLTIARSRSTLRP